jgi:hypothetical protein
MYIENNQFSNQSSLTAVNKNFEDICAKQPFLSKRETWRRIAILTVNHFRWSYKKNYENN